jgi:hypothetical protein
MMSLDFGKCFKVAMIPIVALILVNLVENFIGWIPFLGLILCFIWPLFTLARIAIVVYAGWSAAKAGMDLVGGAVTGAITGAVGAFVGALLTFGLSIAGIGASALEGDAGVGSVIGAGFGILAIIFAPIGGAIFGAIFGLVGAFIGGMKK